MLKIKNDFIKEVIEKIKKSQIKYLSAETTYHFIIALVPFLIVMINLVSFFAKENLERLVSFLEILPKETSDILENIINMVISQSSGALLSIGLIIAIWSSSKGMESLIRALNKAFGLKEEDNFIRKKLKAIFYTILIVILIIVVMTTMVFGDFVLGIIDRIFKLSILENIPLIYSILKYIIPIAGMIVVFSILFKFAPNFKESSISIKTAIISGSVATIGWIIITLLYSFYVTNISNMSNTYGGLVGIFTLLIWLNLSSKIIIVSAEFASVYEKHYGK
ncbi:MAG: YihY/virulence factor BrkB family protein [Tissierellia bacterium]|nr:YihY/virulence factor BrkB family protein [Tissierellia bacterium]